MTKTSAPSNLGASPARRGPTLGVEEEFFLIDAFTRQPVECNEAVVAHAHSFGFGLDLELKRTQIETSTPVCTSARELRAAILAGRAAAVAAAVQQNAALLASGVQPQVYAGSAVTERPRYQAMSRRYGALIGEHEISGCHVHVGVRDRETAVHVCNHIRLWLPALLALTANSSVYCGRDTGYSSWRSILASRWPCSGAPPYFSSVDHYEATVAMMLECGAALDEAMIYWDVRPSAHLPTVEIRVSDVPSTVDETILLAMLVKALVVRAEQAVEAGEVALPAPGEVMRAAYLCAARNGVTGNAVDVFTCRTITARHQLRSLLRHVRPELEQSGEYTRAGKLLKHIFDSGNGAVIQRRAFAQRQDANDVVAALARRTLAESWLRAVPTGVGTQG